MRRCIVGRSIALLLGLALFGLITDGTSFRRAAQGAEPQAADSKPAGGNPWHDAPYFVGRPGSTAYVSIDSLPVFSADGLTDVRLKLGQEVFTTADPTAAYFIGIKWKAGAETKFGTVTAYGLSRKKPAEVAAPAENKPSAAADEAPNTVADRKRLEGTWLVVGLKVLGHTNPDRELQITEKDGPNPPAGLVGPTGDRGIWYFTPHTVLHRFHDDTIAKWSLQPNSLPTGKMIWLPQREVDVRFSVDATMNPRRIDEDFGIPPHLKQPRPGIYRWHAGDLLEWAVETPWGPFSMPIGIFPDGAQSPRLAGFAPEQLKKATVLYLIRVDEKKYPPPAPPKTPAQQQGGNAF